MPQCVGVLGKGTQCTKNVRGNLDRCGIHQRTLVDRGPGQTALQDLYNIIKITKGNAVNRLMLEVAAAEVPNFPNAQNFGEFHMMRDDQRQAYYRQYQFMSMLADRVKHSADNWHMARINALEIEFRNAAPLAPVNLTHLIEEVRQNVIAWTRTGLNQLRMGRRFAAMFGDQPLPQQPPRRRVDPAVLEAERVRRENEAQARQARRVARANAAVRRANDALQWAQEVAGDPNPNQNLVGDLIAQAQRLEAEANRRVALARMHARDNRAAVPAAPAPQVRGELEVFARDRQNVHTTQSVQMTKDIVERVLRIQVPEDYRWNPRTVSKTAGEIIVECRLRPNSVAQFISRYIASENIYEMGVGIFGKVLDSVWQFIRNSEHKADLCRILEQELRDNEGMCLQGNLTRICNVLAGYLEGVGPQESAAERLGRELPKLMDMPDAEARMNTARRMMADVGLPEAEWAPWLEALE